MGKHFELLAVEGDHQSRVKKLTADILKTFSDKLRMFQGKQRRLKMFDQSPEKVVEIAAIERKEATDQQIAATVPQSLNYYSAIVAEYFDVLLQKEIGNSQAKADIIIDGVTIAKDIPVMLLLGLESRLQEYRSVIVGAPTLDPSIAWTNDVARGKYVYRTPEIVTIKTSKETKYITVAPATDKHPAQVIQKDVTENVGQYTDIEWSGAVSSADKAAILTRVDRLIQAIKKARQRANDLTASDAKIGDALFAYVLGDWYDPASVNPDAKV